MNIIKIYLNKNASGSVAELYKDFALFTNSYQNKLIDVYVPKSMLYSNEEITFINAVKIGALLTAQNGETITSDSYYLNYLKDETINNVEYSVYERILPKEFTVYPGNVTITTNVLSMDNTDVLSPVMLQVVTTQTSNLLVQNSAYIGDETPVEPTKTAIIEGQLAQDRYEILDLKDRMTDAETQINLNTENIATNTEDIAKIKLSVNISETYIGQMTGSSLPTTTQLNNYVELAVDRTPNNGDVIIFVLTKTNETDKNYKYIYSLATGWNYYELPPMEPAYNGSLGLVKGSYNVGVTRNVLIDLNAGEFTNIYVKNVTTNNYLTLDTFINNLYNEQQGIKNGTIAVGLATKAVNDGNGANIASTYMTNNAGATKEYVQNYALPKEFFQMYFIDSNGYVNEPPTEPSNGVQFTKQVNAVGEFNIFNISRINASSIKLTNKNSAETSIYISANQDTTFQLKLTTYAQKQGESAQNLSIELSNEITITSGDIYKVDFQSNFNELIGILDLSNGDILGQNLSVITQSSQSTTYTIISNDVYPSSQIMNTQSLVVIGQQGNLGEIPVYELTGAITGTNIDFDFGNNQIYGNTLARFLLKVNQQTALPLNYTLNLIYNNQNVRIATPYNYLTGNATIENLQQTNITFDAVNGTTINFVGFINIDSGDNITVFVNEDNFSDFQSKIVENVLNNLPLPTKNSPDFVQVRDLNGACNLYRKKVFTNTFNGTDLTNTAWNLNSSLTKPSYSYDYSATYNITFINEGVVYNSIRIVGEFSGIIRVYYDNQVTYFASSSNSPLGVLDDKYRKIQIIGGDVTNTSIINWINSNGTLIENELIYSYEELQDKQSYKTINNQSIIGEGNITIPIGIQQNEVINRPQTTPIANATSPDFIEKDGIIYYKKLSTTITDLTNSSWVFNEDVILGDPSNGDISVEYSLNFNSNSNTYTSLGIYDSGALASLRYGANGSYSIVYGDLGWNNNEYKIINITGGTDVANSDLIDWLQQNAILQSGTTTTGYSYVEIGAGSGSSSGSSGGITQEILWENPNPTSNFGSQTVETKDISNYDYILVGYTKATSTYNAIQYVMFKSLFNENTVKVGLAWGDGNSIGREIEACTKNSITFGNAYVGSSAQNQYIIPQQIIGIRIGGSTNQNIYSTEEVVIGTYLGKPLYRKVFILSTPITISQSSWTDSGIGIVENAINYIIKASCINTDKTQSPLLTAVENRSTVAVLTPRTGNHVDDVNQITLEYTKTTDL